MCNMWNMQLIFWSSCKVWSFSSLMAVSESVLNMSQYCSSVKSLRFFSNPPGPSQNKTGVTRQFLLIQKPFGFTWHQLTVYSWAVGTHHNKYTLTDTRHYFNGVAKKLATIQNSYIALLKSSLRYIYSTPPMVKCDFGMWDIMTPHPV